MWEIILADKKVLKRKIEKKIYFLYKKYSIESSNSDDDKKTYQDFLYEILKKAKIKIKYLKKCYGDTRQTLHRGMNKKTIYIICWTLAYYMQIMLPNCNAFNLIPQLQTSETILATKQVKYFSTDSGAKKKCTGQWGQTWWWWWMSEWMKLYEWWK